MAFALETSNGKKNALKKLKDKGADVIVLNKIDLLSNPNELFPILKNFQNRFPDATMIPLSAQKEKNLEALKKEIKSWLPESPFCYPEDQITDRSQRFLIAEIIREKIMRQLGKEIPYQTAVVLDLSLIHI